MIRYPPLREIICPDPFAPVARTDLAAPCFRHFCIGFLLGFVQQARLQYAHGLGPVFQLGPFVLAFDNNSRRHMGHADSRTRLIDVLTAGPAGSEIIDADIIHIQIDFHIFRFRQYGYRSGRRMNAAAGFRNRYTLHTVYT